MRKDEFDISDSLLEKSEHNYKIKGIEKVLKNPKHRQILIKETEKAHGFMRPLSWYQMSTWVVCGFNVFVHVFIYMKDPIDRSN